MIRPSSFLKKGLWFVRFNPVSGLGCVTAPSLCLNRTGTEITFQHLSTGNKATCTLGQVAYVSRNPEELQRLYAVGSEHLKKYEELRLRFVKRHTQQLEEAITQACIQPKDRFLASFTLVRQGKPTLRFLTFQGAGGKVSLLVFKGLLLAHELELSSLNAFHESMLLRYQSEAHLAGFTDFCATNKFLSFHAKQYQNLQDHSLPTGGNQGGTSTVDPIVVGEASPTP